MEESVKQPIYEEGLVTYLLPCLMMLVGWLDGYALAPSSSWRGGLFVYYQILGRLVEFSTKD